MLIPISGFFGGEGGGSSGGFLGESGGAMVGWGALHSPAHDAPFELAPIRALKAVILAQGC